jgi:hypothetical protein
MTKVLLTLSLGFFLIIGCSSEGSSEEGPGVVSAGPGTTTQSNDCCKNGWEYYCPTTGYIVSTSGCAVNQSAIDRCKAHCNNVLCTATPPC